MQDNTSRLKMVDYFCQVGNEMLLDLKHEGDVEPIAELFKHEHIQFQQGLPMYARKEEFLSLQSAQCTVLVGGTGIGELQKTFVHDCFDT